MKRKITSVLLIALIAFSFFAITSCTLLGTSRYSRYDSFNEYTKGGGEFSSEGITSLEIGWINGNITVESYDGDTVSVSESASGDIADEDRMYHRIHGTKLTVHYAASGAGITVGASKDLTIRIPKELELSSLEIESVSAQIKLDLTTASSLDVETVSGDLEAKIDGRVSDFTLSSVSGKATVMAELTGDVDIETVSGAVIVETSATPRDIGIESVSANITLILPEDADFTLEFDSVSGNLESDFATTVSNGRYTVGNGTSDFEIETVSGNINLQICK